MAIAYKNFYHINVIIDVQSHTNLLECYTPVATQGQLSVYY